MYCKECNNECSIEKYDDSFDHEFGIEERHHFGSDCCDGDVYKEQCKDCDGEGAVMFSTVKKSLNGAVIEEYDDEIGTCDNCDGIGYFGEMDQEDMLAYWRN